MTVKGVCARLLRLGKYYLTPMEYARVRLPIDENGFLRVMGKVGIQDETGLLLPNSYRITRNPKGSPYPYALSKKGIFGFVQMMQIRPWFGNRGAKTNLILQAGPNPMTFPIWPVLGAAPFLFAISPRYWLGILIILIPFLINPFIRSRITMDSEIFEEIESARASLLEYFRQPRPGASHNSM